MRNFRPPDVPAPGSCRPIPSPRSLPLSSPTIPNLPFETDDAESAFKHFFTLVASIPEVDLDAYNADPDIVRVNARRGTDAIRPHLDKIGKALPAGAIVALYREHKQALAGKHPFDNAYLQKLADDGNWLVAQLMPAGAKPQKAGKSPDALVRDRLWTELNRRHDELYKAGVVIWGRRKVDEHIPPLLARQTSQQSAPEPASAQPSEA